VRGAREALQPLLDADRDFRLAWAFIDMMDTDDASTAAAAVARFADARLTGFHDAGRQLGRAMARRLGWKHHVAWDTYFVYEPGRHWTGTEMPFPDVWFHQLRDREMWEQVAEAEVGSSDWTRALAEKSEADPAHFATGADLRIALAEALDHAAMVAAHV
jgi:hypothetical protein